MTATHRKASTTASWTEYATLLGICILAALSALGCLVISSRMTSPAERGQIAASTMTLVTVTPVQRTCNAFVAVESAWKAQNGITLKRTLVKVVTDSFRLQDGKPGLASDIGQLWADYAGGGLKYIDRDIEYVRDDCGGAN